MQFYETQWLFRYGVHKIAQFGLYPRLVRPDHTIRSCFSNFHFNILLLFTYRGLPSDVFPWTFLTQVDYALLLLTFMLNALSIASVI